jgi:7-cyano-7-deazaguanine synthase
MKKKDKKRGVVLLSGGLDSTVSLACALKSLDVRLVLFFDYGQRAVAEERGASMAIATYYSLPFKEVDIRWLGEISPRGMRSGAGAGGRDDSPLGDLESVWIPNRNGVMINIAAAFAESYDCDYVVTGFNREEAVSFPDNRLEYMARLNRCLCLSTLRGVRVISFTGTLSKREIIEAGVGMSAPLASIWSCYRGGQVMCGRCASCSKLVRALESIPAEMRPRIEFDGPGGRRGQG